MSARDALTHAIAVRPAGAGTTQDAARRLRGVHLALSRLSGLDSVARLESAAPREACRSAGFDRAMLSHIRGDRLTFASVSFEGNPVLAADFARLARAVRPRLDRCAPEHEAVVRQMPVLVRDVPNSSGVFRPLTHVARTEAYVVAPIVRDGHTVGLLHADVFGGERELDELDRELLWTLAAGIGWAMERLAAQDGAGASRTDLELAALPAQSVPAPTPGPAVTVPEAGSTAGRLRTLTAREHEVLQLMAEGASNASIGEALVISQATVKSHVRHILRKLGAANRTEAVSLFLAVGARASASS
jgi:DNA-binding CsgD family transcriptional regulator